MATKHQKQLANQKRRQGRRKLKTNVEENVIEITPIITNNQKESQVHIQIEKAKTFIKKHKKGFVIAGVVIGAAALAVVATKMAKNGKLVTLVGEAAKDYAKLNQSPMTSDQVKIKIKLMKNPGKVVVNAEKNKMWVLICGELASVNYNFETVVNGKSVNDLYIASMDEGFGGNVTGYFYKKDVS